jgi:hypothetical protein
LRGSAALARYGESVVLQHYSRVAGAPKPLRSRDQANVNTVSFPLAPNAVFPLAALRTDIGRCTVCITPRWLPDLSYVVKFKWTRCCGNEAIENVRNTSGEKSFRFMNMA